MRLLQFGGSRLGDLAELARLEASDLRVETDDRLEHILGVDLLIVASLFEDLERLLNMVVKVLEDVVGLGAAIGGSGSLVIDALSQVADAAVFLTGLVVAVALSADKVGVSALRLQVSLESTPGNLGFLAGSARYLLLRARLTVSGLLEDLEWGASTAIGALDDSEFALFEDMVGVVLVGNRFALARVITAVEGGAVEHGLLNGVQLVNGLDGLLATLASLGLGVRLAGTADQLVALFAVASVNSGERTIGAVGRLNEHGVGPIVELLEAALDLSPVVGRWR